MSLLSENLKKFAIFINSLLPGYLALFDLADTRKRNFHLGHTEVDKDIAIFENLLKAYLGKDYFIRIQGDKWVAYITELQLNNIPNLISEYEEKVSISAGWQCIAINIRKIEKIVEEKKSISLTRGVRCGYSSIVTTDDLMVVLDRLVEKVGWLPINIATPLEQKLLTDRLKHDVEDLQNPIYCPFCHSKEFNWLDGSNDTAYGICKQCNAEVDFLFS